MTFSKVGKCTSCSATTFLRNVYRYFETFLLAKRCSSVRLLSEAKENKVFKFNLPKGLVVSYATLDALKQSHLYQGRTSGHALFLLACIHPVTSCRAGLSFHPSMSSGSSKQAIPCIRARIMLTHSFYLG